MLASPSLSTANMTGPQTDQFGLYAWLATTESFVCGGCQVKASTKTGKGCHHIGTLFNHSQLSNELTTRK